LNADIQSDQEKRLKKLEEASPSSDLIEEADKETAGLVIIPSQGRNILREMLVGSTARNVVRKSEVPVLLLKYHINSDGVSGVMLNVQEFLRDPFLPLIYQCVQIQL